VCNLDRKSNLRRDTRTAIRWIEESNFGTRQQSGEYIDPKRLAAVPWAPFCRRRQEALDGHSGGIQSPTGDLLGRAA
jgi:RNA polymerase-binding transcription factor DksA